jgi:hypothetical protein
MDCFQAHGTWATFVISCTWKQPNTLWTCPSTIGKGKTIPWHWGLGWQIQCCFKWKIMFNRHILGIIMRVWSSPQGYVIQFCQENDIPPQTLMYLLLPLCVSSPQAGRNIHNGGFDMITFAMFEHMNVFCFPSIWHLQSWT